MKKTIETDELISLTDHDYGFLRHCGSEACHWLAELREAGTLEIMNRTSTALEALKRYDVKTGFELLAAVEGDIRARAAGFPSINHLLERYRVSARAYWYYLNGDLENAKRDLLSAHEEVRTLIGLNGFLLPLAIQCADFVIQRARVARRERQWKEAEHHVRTIHEIFSGLRPLCVLDSGRAVGLADIREFFAALPLDKEQRSHADRYLGDHIPVAVRVEYLEETIFTLPDLVIPYP
jgi:hypothetical protein